MTGYCMTDDDDVYVHDDCHTDCHPVLVLSPDDTEQMRALFSAQLGVPVGWTGTQRMAAAVRSMLTPPKIAEPKDERPSDDSQASGPVRCKLCSRLRMNGLQMFDGVVSCQDQNTCSEVAKAREESRSTYSDLIEAGWKPPKIEDPKIAEPTNRYAVVVDRDGREWVRNESGSWFDPMTTFSLSAREWADISAVRVLSSGGERR